MRKCFRNSMLLIVFSISHCLAFENADLTYLKAFDDSIIYRLAWEKEQENVLKEAEDLETITMISSRKEKYVCILPKMMEKKQVIFCPASLLHLNLITLSACLYLVPSVKFISS